MDRRLFLLSGVALLPAGAAFARRSGWRLAKAGEVKTASLTLKAADGRDVTVSVWAPAFRAPKRPLILFSHGANSAPGKYDRLLRSWAAQGWVVAAPLHVDSTDHPQAGKIDRTLFTPTRLADMALMADNAKAIEAAVGARVDAAAIVAAGHSYGGLIAQVLGGAEIQAFGTGAPIVARDPRVKAIVAFSPPGPVKGLVSAEGWAKIAVPMYLQTGTKDVLPMMAPTWEAHLVAHQSAPPGDQFAFVGTDVDHYFGNIIGRPELQAADQSQPFAAAVASSVAFLAAILLRDAGARRWLETGGVKADFGAAVHSFEKR
jgi:alpha-beta hydrolase superfamily lysophospholipase